MKARTVLLAVVTWIVSPVAATLTGAFYSDEILDVLPCCKGLVAPHSERGFEFETTIKGKRVKWILDTGASVVVLTKETADLMEIDFAPERYTELSSVAGETIAAAPAAIKRLQLGNVGVDHVETLVLQEDHASGPIPNLVGMSFLGQLRWRYRNNSLTLRE